MSSSDVTVSVRDLSKKYTITHDTEKHTTAAEALLSRLKNPLKQLEKETFWALQDVNFDINKGDVLGIIGKNGAGKSTLLKVLSRITEPTTGQIDLYGRVGSLLEVGTGFHPELTGRENVFLNGAVLGMSKREIRSHFDDIVDFSGTEHFLDTPVKRYSSGMYVRLAFAVAAHLKTEILIVDEVLAVGDSEFQKKCLGKMQDVASSGRTILFVSHNMTAVQSLCNRVLHMEKGRVIESGETKSVISKYLHATSTRMAHQVWENQETAPGNEYVRLHRVDVTVLDSMHQVVTVKTPIKIDFALWNKTPNMCLNLSMNIFTMDGVRVLNTYCLPKSYPAGLIEFSCTIPGNLLNDETYSIELMVVKDASEMIYNNPDVVCFDVADSERESGYYGKWQGVVRPPMQWTTSFEADEEPLMAVGNVLHGVGK